VPIRRCQWLRGIRDRLNARLAFIRHSPLFAVVGTRTSGAENDLALTQQKTEHKTRLLSAVENDTIRPTICQK